MFSMKARIGLRNFFLGGRGEIRVSIGGIDGAKFCELVGLYILGKLGTVIYV